MVEHFKSLTANLTQTGLLFLSAVGLITVLYGFGSQLESQTAVLRQQNATTQVQIEQIRHHANRSDENTAKLNSKIDNLTTKIDVIESVVKQIQKLQNNQLSSTAGEN